MMSSLKWPLRVLSLTRWFGFFSKRRKIPAHGATTRRRSSKTTSMKNYQNDELFQSIEPSKLAPTFNHPIAGRKYLPGSDGEGFPAFVAGPRDGLPFALQIQHADRFTVAEWAGHCRNLLDETLLKYGVVLFRGLPMSKGKDFSTFTRNLGYTPMDYSGGTGNRPLLDEKAIIYISTLDPKEFTIEPHNEMACSSVHPKKVMFYCDQEPGEDCGGLTTITRNSEVLAKLDPKVVQKLEEKQVRYSRYLPSSSKDTLYVSWQSSFYTDDKKEVEKFLEKAGFSYKWETDDSLMYWYSLPPFVYHPQTGEKVWFTQPDSHHSSYFKASPMFEGVTLENDSLFPAHAMYGDGTEIEPEVIQHIRATNWQCTVGFQWRTGDVAVLDNLAIMHARLSFTGKRRILSFLSSD